MICVNRKGRTCHEENSIDHRCYRRDRFSVYKVISKEELLEKLWNDKYYIDENVLLVNMTRLKKKMKEIGIVHLLENIRGKGWKL